MKKKKSKFIFLILIAIIIIMLVGCIDDEDFSDTTDSNASTYEAEDEGETSELEKDMSNKPRFTFSTTDINGNSVSIDDYSDYNLIMVNFWEPWCGPCVREMPELEELYEDYKEEGFIILGIYSSTDMDREVREVLNSCGTTYPILRYKDEMEPYTSDYVPTTVFLGKNGYVLSDEPIISANSYDGWKDIIEEYMNK